MKPSEYWRNTLTYGKVPEGLPSGVYSQEEWLRFSEQYYADQKRRLEQTSPADNLARQFKMGLYMSSIYLLACGRLDVVADILNNQPERESHGLWSLQRAVTMLLPLPAGLSLYKPQDIINWVQENQQRLAWDAAGGKFLLTEE